MADPVSICDAAGEILETFQPRGDALYHIGRASDNDLVLKGDGVGERHAALSHSASTWWIAPVDGAEVLVDGAPIVKEPIVSKTTARLGGVEIILRVGDPSGEGDALEDLRREIYEEVLKAMNLGGDDRGDLSDEDLERKALAIIRPMLDNHPTAAGMSPEEMQRIRMEIIQDLLRLGPLEPLLDDDDVTEIMVVDYRRIYIEKKGKIELSRRFFKSPEHLLTVIERIVSPLGRRIDESSPLVDARLEDGSRVNAVIPPIVPDGACLTIRKFGKNVFNVDRLINYGSMTPNMAEFLEKCVLGRKNIVVSGGTGSGKTSLLNALSMFISSDERIVTIEDSLELKLQQDHVVRMEARPPNAEGKGEVAIRALVKNSLRMRPDRIVIGECRGGEALDMLQAMNTGHDGSLTTVHANSPKDAVARLETLVLMAGMDLPLSAIRNQICSAVDIIVQTSRLSDGSRKVVSVSEIAGIENGEPILREIFKFQREGIDAKHGNKVLGKHVAVSKPTFFDEFKRCGIEMRGEWFE